MSAIHSRQAPVDQSAAQFTVSKLDFFSRLGSAVAGELRQRCSNVVKNLNSAAHGDISFLKNSIPVVVAGAIASRFPTAEACYNPCAGETQPSLDCCDYDSATNPTESYATCSIPDLATQTSDCLGKLAGSLNAINQTAYNAAMAYKNAHSTATTLAPGVLTTTNAADEASSGGGLTSDAKIAIGMGLLALGAIGGFVGACCCYAKRGREIERLEAVVSTNAQGIKNDLTQLQQQIQQQIQQNNPAQLVTLGQLTQRCTTAIASLPDKGATEEQMDAAITQLDDLSRQFQALLAPAPAPAPEAVFHQVSSV